MCCVTCVDSNNADFFNKPQTTMF